MFREFERDMSPEQEEPTFKLVSVVPDSIPAPTLAPLSAVNIRPQPTVTSRRVTRRKKKPVLDSEKLIPTTVYKEQLVNTSDILGTFHLAPRTKRAMLLAAFESVGKFFSTPGRHIPSAAISSLFYRSLKFKTELLQERESEKDGELPPLDAELCITPARSLRTEDTDTAANSDTPTTSIKKAESFDRLVQGMCKNRDRNKTVDPHRRRQRRVYPAQTKSRSTTFVVPSDTESRSNSNDIHPGNHECANLVTVTDRLNLQVNGVTVTKSDLQFHSPNNCSVILPDGMDTITAEDDSLSLTKAEPLRYGEYYVVTPDEDCHYSEVPPDVQGVKEEMYEESTTRCLTPTAILQNSENFANHNSEEFVADSIENLATNIQLTLKNDCDEFEDHIYANGSQEDPHEGLLYYTADACTSEVMLIESDASEIHSSASATDPGAPVQFYVYMP